MSEFQCRTEIPAVPGLPDNEITVGRKFIVHCEGPFPRDIEPEKVQLQLAPANKYDLKLFGFEFRSLSAADLLVTTYRAGPLEVPLQIQYGEGNLALGVVKLQVKSVLPPADPRQGQQQEAPQPYPPMGPVNLPVPTLYWALLVGALLCVGSYIFFKVLRHVQRKNMIENLKEYDSALTPVNQFYQNLRRLQRENSSFSGVKASPEDVASAIKALLWMWEMYLTRRFQVPAEKWNGVLILSSIKKYHRPVYNELQTDFKKIFKEVQGFKTASAQFDETDVQNFSKQVRTLIEKVERLS